MKLTPKSLAKLIGLGAGAFFGGPLFACLGSTCGGFIGEMFDGQDEGGWDMGNSFGGVFGNLFAGKLQPMFEDVPSGFNHDLRRAAAHALVAALEWKTKPGPLAASLLKTSPFSVLSPQRKELLQRLILRWRDHIAASLKEAEKNKDASLLDAILPRSGSDAFTRLSDDKLSAEAHNTSAWAAFYQQTLQPVLDAIVNQDERHQFDHADLHKHVTASLAAVFPACFTEALKSPDQKRAWIAYQKTLLSALQRAVDEIGSKTTRLPEIEKKIDTLIKSEQAGSELDARLNAFLETASSKIDGTWKNTKNIKKLVNDSRTSIETLLRPIQKGIDDANHKLDALLALKPLNQYRRNLIARFSKHNSIGIPAVEDTKQKQGPDPIQQLFVQPTCAIERLRPEDLPSVSNNANRRPTSLLSRLATEKRVVLLADPGMGKSTLIQWLVVTLADAVPSAEAAPLGRGIPLPIILRDLVSLMPPKLEDWTWKALISCFLKHQLDETQPGMADPLRLDDDSLREIMQSPYTWFLIDGLDEVGDKAKRTAMRDAIWQGFDAHPKARFLVTSRIVGYEEAEIDPLLDSILLTDALTKDPHLYKSVFECLDQAGLITVHDDNTAEISSLTGAVRVLRSQGSGVEDHFDKAIGVALVDRATRFYLSPWNIEQQSGFAKKWFSLRLGEHDGPLRARDFVRAVHDHPSTCAIGRVPNILLLMALLYRYRADLPHGRAKVYAGISQAYLENIAQVCRIDHRSKTSVPYTFAQKERLLALLAMHLQLRRCAEDGQSRGNSPVEPESEILASKEDLQRWLCSEFGQASDEANRHEMDKFIDHIADSSGLLLPRGVKDGQEQFAFAHLSFQEYYAACWLELEFSRLLNLHAAAEDDLLDPPTPPPDEELAMTEALFAKRATFIVWREPLLFLAEKLSDRQSDTLTLRKWLFPIRNGQTLPMPAQRLLATFSIDPQVSFTPEQRQAIWDHLCRAHLANEDVGAESVASSLLVPSAYQQTILRLMASLATKTQQANLYLIGCTGLRDLTALKDLGSLRALFLNHCTGVGTLPTFQGFSSLQNLVLAGCTEVSSLASLKDLGSLRSLFLNGCAGVGDLTELQSLSSLQLLILTECTGVSDLAALQGLSSLHTLSLNGCTGVSDLTALQGLRSLQWLDLRGCTGVKDLKRQITELQKALPKCHIFTEPLAGIKHTL